MPQLIRPLNLVTNSMEQTTEDKENERQLMEDQAATDRDTMMRGLPYDSCLHINNMKLTLST